MSSYNKLTIVGRLTHDPELTYTNNGKARCRFSVAVNRPTEKNEVDFFPVVAWERLAETCGKYLTKGQLVLIEGPIQFRSYDKDGVEHKVTEVIAREMRMLGSKNGNGGSDAAPAQAKAKPNPQDGDGEGVDDIQF